MRRSTRALVAPTTLGWLAALALGDDGEGVTPRPWPHQQAGLPHHPDVTFGHLDNGIRFAWRRFPDPRDEIFLWLDISAGSLSEADDERGMAHFLEHLGFWGGGRFDKGEMIAWAQRNGLDFGPDLNGFTDYDRTSYVLQLPRNDRELLVEALQVLREYVDGASLELDAVEIEKGVVDAEEREREGKDAAARRALRRFLYEGSRIADRDPIGVRSDRSRFTPERLRRFRDRHYGPRNLTIIAAGDLTDPTSAIEEVFGDLLPRAPVELDIGVPKLTDPVMVHHDERYGSARVRLRRVVAEPYVPRDAAARIEEAPLLVAVKAMSRRLSLLRDDHPLAVESASLELIRSAPAAPLHGVVLDVLGPAERWEEAYSAAVDELRAILEHGFSVEEVARARALVERDMDRRGPRCIASVGHQGGDAALRCSRPRRRRESRGDPGADGGAGALRRREVGARGARRRVGRGAHQALLHRTEGRRSRG